MKRTLLPLVVFLVLVAFLAVGLKLDPHHVPSPLIGRPAPAFELPRLDAPDRKVARKDLLGQVWVLNVWASWCGPCRQEHALIADLAKTGGVAVYGLNYKDTPAAAIDWLATLGNPYAATLSDRDGLVGIDYGVYGVPETFVIDREGVVRLKHIGPMTLEALRDSVLPMLVKLRKLDA